MKRATKKYKVRQEASMEYQIEDAEGSGATWQQAIAKTHAKRSAYQILSVNVLFVDIVLKT
jgi:hypothetical protein